MLCHVQFSNTLLDIPASKVFHVRADFNVEKGAFRRLSSACTLLSCVQLSPYCAYAFQWHSLCNSGLSQSTLFVQAIQTFHMSL